MDKSLNLTALIPKFQTYSTLLLLIEELIASKLDFYLMKESYIWLNPLRTTTNKGL